VDRAPDSPFPNAAPPVSGPPAAVHTSANMGRMHSTGKGMSSSALPYKRSSPSWLKITSQEVTDIISKLAKKGMTPSQIGVLLRDNHGVAQVSTVTNSKILRILKGQGLAPTLPEDLYCLIKKVEPRCCPPCCQALFLLPFPHTGAKTKLTLGVYPPAARGHRRGHGSRRGPRRGRCGYMPQSPYGPRGGSVRDSRTRRAVAVT